MSAIAIAMPIVVVLCARAPSVCRRMCPRLLYPLRIHRIQILAHPLTRMLRLLLTPDQLKKFLPMVGGVVVVAICYPQGCFAPFVLRHPWWTPILCPVPALLRAPFVAGSTVSLYFPFSLFIAFQIVFESYPSILLFHCLDALLDGTCWLGHSAHYL